MQEKVTVFEPETWSLPDTGSAVGLILGVFFPHYEEETPAF